MPKTFELIRPKSLVDTAYAGYEYLIRWIGRDGSDYLYMFCDAEVEGRTDAEVINRESTTQIMSLINRIGTRVTLSANDLSLSDLLIIQQIFENPVIMRLLLSGTEERYAPEANSFRYQLMAGRYDVEFTLVKTDTKTWR
jgi:hypothetical protein